MHLLNGIREDNPDWYLWIKFFLECCERMTSKLIEKMKNAEQLAKECLSKCRLDTEKKYGCTLFKNLIAKFQISTHLSVQQLQFVKR